MDTQGSVNDEQVQGLSVNNLPSATRKQIQCLIDMSEALDLERPTGSSFHVALSERMTTMMDLDLERQDLQDLTDTLQERTRLAQDELASLQRLLKIMQDERIQTEEPLVRNYEDQIDAMHAQERHDRQQIALQQADADAIPAELLVTSIQALERQMQAHEAALNETQLRHPELLVDDNDQMPSTIEELDTLLHAKMAEERSLERERDRLLADMSRSMLPMK